MIGLRFDVIGQSLPHRGARRGNRERSVLGNFGRKFLRGSAHFGERHQHIRQADPQRLLARQPAARVEHQARLLRADQRGQSVCQPEARMKPKPREVGREPRFGTRHAEIRNQRQSQPATDRRTMDGANDGLFRAEQSHRFLVEMPNIVARRLVGAIAVFVQLAAIAEVGTRAECRSLRRQHQCPHFVCRIQRLERRRDLLDQRHVEEIVRRALYNNGGDVALDRNGEVGECWQ